LSAAANLFLGRETTWGRWFRLLDQKRMDQESAQLLRRLGLDCDPHTRVDQLAPGQRQLVQIAHALALQARILIMDQPTSSLTQQETDRLFQVIDNLKNQGVAIVYISHRLAEIERIADRAVVLRDGKNAGKLARSKSIPGPVNEQVVSRETLTSTKIG